MLGFCVKFMGLREIFARPARPAAGRQRTQSHDFHEFPTHSQYLSPPPADLGDVNDY